MSAATLFRHNDFREGRWRNGRGVSWDIASDRPGDVIDWRLAIARIDSDVPFSHYPGIDRIFTLIEGAGLSLDVAGAGVLPVPEPFVPIYFSGDADCTSTLVNGPCRALNLFLRRGVLGARVIIHDGGGATSVGHAGDTLLFVLRGSGRLGDAILGLEDAARINGPAQMVLTPDAALYEAHLLAPSA
jgi:environmental stress-induced protein Ves